MDSEFNTLGFDYARHQKEIDEDVITVKYDYKKFEICGVIHHVIKVKFEKSVEK